MIAKVLTSYNGKAADTARRVLADMGITIWTSQHFYYDIIICPDYEKILTDREISGSTLGALVFHPSPLPAVRGKDAIKRQYKRGDRIGGGTWFWADSSIDGGDICEQEVCTIDLGVKPSEYYNDKIIPIMESTLIRAVRGIMEGRKRAIKQRK